MTVDTVSLFLALLAVIAEAGTATAVVLAVGRRLSGTMARASASVADFIGPQAILLALAVAVVATSGSLYFSEVAHFRPCRLCWMQRFCMYPLVPILAYATWKADLRVRRWAMALAGVGALIAAYHVVIEHYPTLESSVCDPKNPCTLIWVKRFGYLTIPAMALSAFAVILVLLPAARRPD